MRETEDWRPWAPGRAVRTPGLAQVIGHRGAAARAPENTLAGLRRAHALGARWVEFDVMLTRDRVPVLIHDETLDRTTSGRGEVAGHDLADLAPWQLHLAGRVGHEQPVAHGHLEDGGEVLVHHLHRRRRQLEGGDEGLHLTAPH